MTILYDKIVLDPRNMWSDTAGLNLENIKEDGE